MSQYAFGSSQSLTAVNAQWPCHLSHWLELWASTTCLNAQTSCISCHNPDCNVLSCMRPLPCPGSTPCYFWLWNCLKFFPLRHPSCISPWTLSSSTKFCMTASLCYTLSRPKTHWVFGDCAMGFWTLTSPVIRSIHHHDYSIYSSSPEFCPPFAFHVSELHFVSCLCFTSHLCPPCSISVPQSPTLIYAWFPLPWHDSVWGLVFL